jgi:hypothetical protein
MDTLRIKYAVSMEDFLDAQRADRALRQGRHSATIITIGCVVLATLGVVYVVLHPAETAGYILIVCAVFLPLMRGPALLQEVRRQYRLDKNLQYEVTMEIDGDGIVSSNLVDSGRTLWQGFHRALEANSVFTLYPSDKIVVIIPKRAFTPEQLTEFRELLARKIPQKK